MSVRLLLVILAAFAAGGLLALTSRQSFTPTATQSGKALIGGPFTLTNQKGERVTDESFRGKYMLVSFGYTSCPDICPAELQLMANAIDLLGANAEKITPIFVTIDPERDTVQQIAAYVENFSPRMVGLTGTPEEVKEAASAYRVYYAKAEGASTASGYLMDHSTFLYLMDPQGQYVTHFAYGTTREKLADAIAKAMRG
jgi:cytochrome oxidase Cu insertion factor (SCO1/SenC/PrrC family)